MAKKIQGGSGKAARRRLQDIARRQRGDVKAHGAPGGGAAPAA